jgi:hypothetical protein
MGFSQPADTINQLMEKVYHRANSLELPEKLISTFGNLFFIFLIK